MYGRREINCTLGLEYTNQRTKVFCVAVPGKELLLECLGNCCLRMALEALPSNAGSFSCLRQGRGCWRCPWSLLLVQGPKTINAETSGVAMRSRGYTKVDFSCFQSCPCVLGAYLVMSSSWKLQNCMVHAGAAPGYSNHFLEDDRLRLDRMLHGCPRNPFILGL